MNDYAILHIPDSQYCFPKNEKEIEIRLRVAKDDNLEVFVLYGCKYEFAKTRERQKMNKRFSSGMFNYYVTNLTLSDVRLVYVFEIIENGKSRFFSEDGLTPEYEFENCHYNCFQFPYINAIDVHREVEWMKNTVFYQVFVDRFCMADKEKNRDYITMKWNDIPTPKSFAGGDIKGIVSKIDYLKDLGIGALYLTPIFMSSSNHKYNIVDYKTVDKHFGKNEDVQELVANAHEKGIRVILDAVFNHCSDQHFTFADVKKNGKKSKYFDWFIIHGDCVDQETTNYECFASCKYMPKLNTSNLEVQEYLLDIATYWIKEYDIDGWRLDVSDEVSHDFWKKFRQTIKDIKKDAVIIGENWHDARPFLRGDEYDSIMNYAFTKATLDFFAFQRFDAKQYTQKLAELLMRNTTQVNSMMLNLLDSHDTHRFLTRVDGNKNKLLSALAACFFFLGTPCIYYGTEHALLGGYDPDCRRSFDESMIEKNKSFFETVKSIVSLKTHPALQGEEIVLEEENGLAIIERTKGDNKLVLYINCTGKSVKLKSNKPVLLQLNYSKETLSNDGFVIF